MTVYVIGLQVWVGTASEPMADSITRRGCGGVVWAYRASVGEGGAKGCGIRARRVGRGCVKCFCPNL